MQPNGRFASWLLVIFPGQLVLSCFCSVPTWASVSAFKPCWAPLSLQLAGAPETFPRHSAGLQLLLSPWILSPFPPGSSVCLPVGTFQMSWFVLFVWTLLCFSPPQLGFIFFFFLTLFLHTGWKFRAGWGRKKNEPRLWMTYCFFSDLHPLAWASW